MTETSSTIILDQVKDMRRSTYDDVFESRDLYTHILISIGGIFTLTLLWIQTISGYECTIRKECLSTIHTRARRVPLYGKRIIIRIAN